MPCQLPIVVTEPEYLKARDIFAAVSDMSITVAGRLEADVVAKVRSVGAWGVILGVETYTGDLYEALPSGGIIARFGVGHDGIDKSRATARGIYVTNTPGVLEDAVAEHAAALLLGVCKSLGSFAISMRDGRWAPSPTRELRGRPLTVVGCGAIGRRLGRIAAHGFGMQVTGVETAAGQTEELCNNWGFSAVVNTLEEGLRKADFVSIHIPSIPATRHLFGEKVFAMMPRGTVLINTARGAVVDEGALFDALSSGHLSGTALDVFESEPYVPAVSGKDLRCLPNVLMTPHVSSGTVEACGRLARAAIRNVRAARDGHFEALDLVNREMLSLPGDGQVQFMCPPV